MKRIILILLPCFLIGCKEVVDKPVSKKNILSEAFKLNLFKENISHSDTIYYSCDRTNKFGENVLVTLLKEKYTRDSICTADFKLDFIKNGKIFYSDNVRIKGFDKGSEWSGSLELDSISSPIRTISVGYAACGYVQNNFLFYLNDKNSKLIHQWETLVDSGWGTHTELVSGTPENFYCRTIGFFPKVENNEEIGIAEYSDSIHFELKNNKWVKKYLTTKGKVYRTKEVPFGNFNG